MNSTSPTNVPTLHLGTCSQLRDGDAMCDCGDGRPVIVPDMPLRMWVLCPDYGCEGLARPIMAFLDKPTAERAKALIEAAPAYQKIVLHEVPVWAK